MFRSHDLSGLAKTLWVICVIIVPLLGALSTPEDLTCHVSVHARRPGRFSFSRQIAPGLRR